jgi:poly(beta-D-mannuronate) lyase
MRGCVVLLAIVTAAAAPISVNAEIVTANAAGSLAAAIRNAKPGDTIVMANGTWSDIAIVMAGRGTVGHPITLRAEHPGKVVITGRSSLKIAGRHLVVAGLVFRDGYAPNGEVIAFRNGSKEWAEHSRLTDVVVDRFNQPDRRKEDHWVALYGRDNRVDHAHFEGKENGGAMMVVVRDAARPLDNRHRIDHSYFGPRPVLGSNGGETIRIGTSTESASASHTIVEDNIFERCDGEVEIVSVKSGGNIVRRNVFLQSQGSVVLRHGDGNLVEDNVFLGGGIAHTGGVRVINRGQIVRGNYMEGLAGTEFTSAVTVMNGVPNSPINRYVPVSDALIERNSVIDGSRITFGAGASDERSVAPTATQFTHNLVVNTGGADPFRAEASIAGIRFERNVRTTTGSLALPIDRRTVKLARAANGLLYPTDKAFDDLGASRALKPVAKSDVGVAWYPKPASGTVAFGSGRVLPAVGSAVELIKAVASAGNGDTIALLPGRYRLTAPLVVDRTLTLSGPVGRTAVISYTPATLFVMHDGGRLRLDRLAISGTASLSGDAVIRAAPMLSNYAIEIDDSGFSGMAQASGFDVVATAEASLAERIAIRGSDFADISGAVIAAHAETGTKGLYSAEHVLITNSRFARVGTIADVFRGGTDESTYGPHFRMTGSTITDSGKPAGSILLSGVQETDISDNRFARSGGIVAAHGVGSPLTRIADNVFVDTATPVVRELFHKGPPRALIAENTVRGSQ